ncbi:hypothetical protein [Wukongibacter sp. M2B1]|uniref:hypothetical protein n=1 Tax=Wukongibacter sp. M2B1 TaxID=3088895 RepID=UPI003D7AFFF8
METINITIALVKEAIEQCKQMQDNAERQKTLTEKSNKLFEEILERYSKIEKL